MKYFVAHLLKGDVAEYHRALTIELSNRFHITPLHERVDPHLTVKSFEANEFEITDVERVLQGFSVAATPERFTLDGFGRFGFKTIFLDVPKGNGALRVARELIVELNTLPWMRPSKHEGEKLHASIARYLTHKKFRKVWRHLRGEKPRFRAAFDSVAILKKEYPQSPWTLHRTFDFLSGVSELAPSPYPHTQARSILFP